MESLHNKIMNIQGKKFKEVIKEFAVEPVHPDTIYRIGHRDARHEAAEMAIEYDNLIEELVERLKTAYNEIYENDKTHYPREGIQLVHELYKENMEYINKVKNER